VNWVAWALVGFIALGSLLAVSIVGKPRTPLTGLTAAVVLVLNGLQVWGIVWLATR